MSDVYKEGSYGANNHAFKVYDASWPEYPNGTGEWIRTSKWASDTVMIADTASEHGPSLNQTSVHEHCNNYPLDSGHYNWERHWGCHFLFLAGNVEALTIEEITRSQLSWEQW